MILNEYVQAHCGGKPGELQRRIHEKTGKLLPWPLVWSWCRQAKPSRVGEAHADLIVEASGGLVTRPELIDRAIIAERFFPLIGPRQLMRQFAAGKLAVPAVPPDAVGFTRVLNELAARCTTFEQELDTAARARDALAKQVEDANRAKEQHRSGTAAALQRALDAEQRAIAALAKARERVAEATKANATAKPPSKTLQRLKALQRELKKADERADLASRALALTKQALADARRTRKGRAA
jgi:hypothetical protein